jgi:hypothetical protein
MELLSPGYLDDNDFIDIYKTWKSSKDAYGCNVHNRKYHEKMKCVKGGCSKCILGGENKEKFISNMENRLGEYLNEGGKDVSEFQVGDRVRVIKGGTHSLEIGKIYTVTEYDDEYKERLPYRVQQYWVNETHIEKINTTKTQTTKENNMKDNNIDSNVLAIFGDKVQGNELVVIDRHFTDQMLTRILMEKHHKAIQEACVEAEAKRLEKEEKEG